MRWDARRDGWLWRWWVVVVTLSPEDGGLVSVPKKFSSCIGEETDGSVVRSKAGYKLQVLDRIPSQ